MKPTRNLQMTISAIDPESNFGEEYELTIYHECWTGARWAPITNRVGFYTRRSAEAEAERIRATA